MIDDVNNLETSFNTIKYDIRDVWQHKDLKSTKESFKAVLASHDVITLILKRK